MQSKQMFIYARRAKALSDMSEIISFIIALYVDRRLMKIWREWKMSEICCKGTGAPETRCEYDDAWFCKNPDCKTPALTSTILGAHPSGCPKIYE